MTVDSLLDQFFASPVFETERMFAGVWHVDLAELVFEMYRNPNVTEHLPELKTTDIDEMRTRLEWLVGRNRKWTPPVGSFPMFHKSDRTLVGTAMIKPMPDRNGDLTNDVEIGWHLSHPYWGKGYASEFGRRLLEIGFNDLDYDILRAVMSSKNVGSQNVARRIGMTHVGQTELYYGEHLELYEMRNPTHLKT